LDNNYGGRGDTTEMADVDIPTEDVMRLKCKISSMPIAGRVGVLMCRKWIHALFTLCFPELKKLF